MTGRIGEPPTGLMVTLEFQYPTEEPNAQKTLLAVNYSASELEAFDSDQRDALIGFAHLELLRQATVLVAQTLADATGADLVDLQEIQVGQRRPGV